MANEIQRTFIALKPDAVERGLIGEIITRFEHKGFKIVAMKLIQATLEMAKKHYAEHEGKDFYPGLISYIMEGPILVMVVEGINAVTVARKMMGVTNPQEATPGTIRADYAQIMQRNIIHGSDSVESAQREMNIYFSPDELCY